MNIFGGKTTLRIETTSLRGVMLLKPSAFEDHRGEYVEIYNKELFRYHDLDIDFVEDDISTAYYGVLKGIHGDDRTWKLISCLHGKFYLIVINYDKTSEDFGKWAPFVLSDRNRHQVLVPPKHGNGHLCLSKKSIFHYKQSEYYEPSRQFTIKWNDPRFNIWWPLSNPILSVRDGG
jgi:dTDP-4-dehydrorhamnose 3,5-epimerase